MKLIAVNGCTLAVEYTVAGGEAGEAVITSVPSTTVLPESQGAYRGELGVTVSGITNSSQGASTPGPAVVVSIPPTSTKILIDGSAPLREGDTVSGVAYPLTTSSPPVAIPTPFTVKITAAGQSSVRCN